jgi:hypothetical protein
MTGLFIFVCDRGFVIVGEAELHEGLALFWHLPRSRTIRAWGTKDGLAELKDGPLDATVLDPVCERSLPFRSVIDIIHLTEKGVRRWAESLSGATSRTTR